MQVTYILRKTEMIFFHEAHKEKAQHNQYWYSASTIDAIVSEILMNRPSRVACLSTPSIFAKCAESGLVCDLFDFDKELIACVSNVSSGCRAIFFDYNHPFISPENQRIYDCVVCDPPFISPEVLMSYCCTIKELARVTAKVIFTSTAENQVVLSAMIEPEVFAVPFLPSIPSLVYQYNIYVNYPIRDNSAFAQRNPEVQS